MRYPASEKLEIIRLVEQSHLPVRRTLATLGILPVTFYRWYDSLAARRARSAGRQTVHGPGGSGTAFRTMFASRSSNWPWTSRSCRPGSWRCASPTEEVLCVGGFGLSAAQGP